MIPNLRTLTAFPRNVVNIALDATARSTYTNLPALTPGGASPPTQVSATAPAKLSTDAGIGHTLAISASATAGALWCGNWDLSALDASDPMELIQVTLPPLFVRWPSIFGGGALAMKFFIARYTGVGAFPFEVLGSPLSVAPIASVAGEYAATGPVTFDWRSVVSNIPVPVRDPLYFSSPQFIATVGFGCQATVTNHGPTAYNAYIDLGFNRDESNVTADPVASWGTAGIQIQCVPRSNCGAFL